MAGTLGWFFEYKRNVFSAKKQKIKLFCHILLLSPKTS